jgi:flagellar biosynthesis protein FliQ
MNQDEVMKLATDALMLAFKVGLPLLLAGLVVGLLVSVFQAVTQIQEMTLSFIPKILAVAVVLIVAGPWMLNQVTSYTSDLYHSIPSLVKEETR